MKKKIALVCIVLLSAPLFGVSEADILKKAKRAGQVTGAAVGAGLGAAGGILVKRKYLYPEKSSTASGDVVRESVIGGLGAAYGVLPGAYLGGKLVEKATIVYLQKKYGISKRLALAYLATEISPTNLAVRDIFQSAEERDKAKVRAFLNDSLTKLFGANWLDTVMKTIGAFLTIERLDSDVSYAKGNFPWKRKEIEARIAALNRQKELVDRTMPSFQENVNKLLENHFLYAIASLYLDTSILGWAWESNQLPRIRQLIQVLF